MRIEEREGTVVIRLENDVMFDGAEGFERTVGEALGRGARVVVIDFAGIDYLASQCLKTITVTAARLRDEGGELVFVNPTERIRQLCRLTRLEWVVRILDDERDLAAPQPAPPPPQDRPRDRKEVPR